MSEQTILVSTSAKTEEQRRELGQTAADLAAGDEATVTIVHSFRDGELEDLAEKLGYGRTVVSPKPEAVARRHSYPRDIANVLDAHDIDYEIRAGVGEDAEVVKQVEEEIDADHIVVAGERRTPVGKAVFGSAAQDILLSASCPTTLVRG